MKKLNDDIVMYIIVNSDLNMSRGKIASQVAHSACDVVLYLANHNDSRFKEWRHTGNTKIILKSNTKLMEEIINQYKNRSKNLWCCYTRDMGKTEVDEDSLTTIAFNPIKKGEVDDIIKKLKLL